MNTLARWMRTVFPDPPESRQRGVTVGVSAIIAALFAYFYITLKYVPDMGIQLLLGAGVLCILVALGPGVTLPMYFATFWGAGITLPGMPVSLNKAMAAVFLLSWIPTLLRRPFRLPMTPSVPLLAIFTIYAVTMGYVFRVPGQSASYQQLFYLVMGFAAASHFRTREEFLRLAGAIVVIACALGTVGLAEYVLRRDLFAQFSDNTLRAENLRINGIAKNAIQYAFGLIWAAPWALLLHVEAKGKAARRWALVALAYIAALCILTRNRQSPIILGAMLLWGVWNLRYRYRTQLLLLLAICALAAAPFFAVRLVERFASPLSPAGRDMSLTIRHDKILAAEAMLEDHLWIGIGLDTYKDKWYEYRALGRTYTIHTEKNQPHYLDLGYLQILVETGVVGAVLFVLTMVSAFVMWVRALRKARKLEDTYCANGLAVVSMGFVQLGLSMFLQDTFFFPSTFLLFGLLFMFVTVTRMECAKRNTAEA